jgi:hypothetical protein
VEELRDKAGWMGSELVDEQYPHTIILKLDPQYYDELMKAKDTPYEELDELIKSIHGKWAWEIMREFEGMMISNLFKYGHTKRFHYEKPPIFFSLCRGKDETGVSGTGEVLTGFVLPNGKTIIEWLSDIKSMTMYNSFEDFLQIHVIRHPNNNHELSISKGTSWEKTIINQKDLEKGVWKLFIE